LKDNRLRRFGLRPNRKRGPERTDSKEKEEKKAPWGAGCSIPTPNRATFQHSELWHGGTEGFKFFVIKAIIR